ncbi:fluoride efflux transporter CrcB [Hamadaea sp. NPDC050747]|uniref:fluoride efflux transporter CrcB n=1 Tax=Hamadaea sp. NPDC050747 TaxID=3155789 RepID=UPI0033FAE684
MTVLLVALGAAFGAPARYLLDRFVQARHDSVFPWGTFAVNVTGSFLLGSFAALSAPYFALLGTGFCGALTTYSTFGYETIRLARTGSTLYALLNVVLSIIAGLLAAWAGLTLFS